MPCMSKVELPLLRRPLDAASTYFMSRRRPWSAPLSTIDLHPAACSDFPSASSELPSCSARISAITTAPLGSPAQNAGATPNAPSTSVTRNASAPAVAASACCSTDCTSHTASMPRSTTLAANSAAPALPRAGSGITTPVAPALLAASSAEPSARASGVSRSTMGQGPGKSPTASFCSSPSIGSMSRAVKMAEMPQRLRRFFDNARSPVVKSVDTVSEPVTLISALPSADFLAAAMLSALAAPCTCLTFRPGARPARRTEGSESVACAPRLMMSGEHGSAKGATRGTPASTRSTSDLIRGVPCGR
mmetsp:Transcript_56358/g.133824  ORF Transcript_56358/g.133824 Transcript_56358/m.133824 type:complete len:305 (-) Transcript_56358:6-920(-)